jgi:hypothetical protein
MIKIKNAALSMRHFLLPALKYLPGWDQPGYGPILRFLPGCMVSLDYGDENEYITII